MKKILFTVIEVLLVVSMLSGCIMVPTPKPDPGSDPDTTPEENITPTPDPDPDPDPENTPLNDLKGTFDRPYAWYYEEGVSLLGDDSYVVYFNFDGFARYYFDAYLADENLSKDSTLKKLMGEGTFFENLRNALPSITNPCQNQCYNRCNQERLPLLQQVAGYGYSAGERKLLQDSPPGNS